MYCNFATLYITERFVNFYRKSFQTATVQLLQIDGNHLKNYLEVQCLTSSPANFTKEEFI